jgi:hypothetical protein
MRRSDTPVGLRTPHRICCCTGFKAVGSPIGSPPGDQFWSPILARVDRNASNGAAAPNHLLEPRPPGHGAGPPLGRTGSHAKRGGGMRYGLDVPGPLPSFMNGHIAAFQPGNHATPCAMAGLTDIEPPNFPARGLLHDPHHGLQRVRSMTAHAPSILLASLLASLLANLLANLLAKSGIELGPGRSTLGLVTQSL